MNIRIEKLSESNFKDYETLTCREAHGDFFVNHPPATTMVEVKSLIDPEMLVEIEADAIILDSKKLTLEVSQEALAICRLDPNAPIPSWATIGSFFSISRTPEELSVVCNQTSVPPDVKSERDWCSLKVKGPLDFTLTGILSSLTSPLAAENISVFSISTFDTDYLLVRKSGLERAVRSLENAGHLIFNGA